MDSKILCGGVSKAPMRYMLSQYPCSDSGLSPNFFHKYTSNKAVLENPGSDEAGREGHRYSCDKKLLARANFSEGAMEVSSSENASSRPPMRNCRKPKATSG